MIKNIIIILIFSLSLIIIFLKFFRTSRSPQFIDLPISRHLFRLELAKTITQKAVGLSNRVALCPNCGMLFVFPGEGILPFWMKDTLIPLDLIWVNQRGIVVTIETAPVENKSLTQLTVYKNTLPAGYVIELNANTAKNIGLQVGDHIAVPSNL